MGDRANVHFKATTEDTGFYLYTHWSGSELPVIVARALKRGKDRWDDPQYLSRIVFCEMVGNDTGETGFGISTQLCDGDDRIITIDCETQQVTGFGGVKSSFSAFTAMV